MPRLAASSRGTGLSDRNSENIANVTNMKGKGEVLTYWLERDTEKNPVRQDKKPPDESKLKPFFRGPQNLVNNVGGNSQEVRLF